MSYNNLDLTPTQVAQELLALGLALAQCVADLDELEADVARSDEAYTMADAAAIIKANDDLDLKTADLRKAWAAKQTHAERLARDLARAKVKARKAKIDVLKTRVTIGQSVATALRSELDLEGLRRR